MNLVAEREKIVTKNHDSMFERSVSIGGEGKC